MSINLTKLNKLDQLLKKAEKILSEAEHDQDEIIRQTITRQARQVIKSAKKAIQEEINKSATN